MVKSRSQILLESHRDRSRIGSGERARKPPRFPPVACLPWYAAGLRDVSCFSFFGGHACKIRRTGLCERSPPPIFGGEVRTSEHSARPAFPVTRHPRQPRCLAPVAFCPSGVSFECCRGARNAREGHCTHGSVQLVDARLGSSLFARLSLALLGESLFLLASSASRRTVGSVPRILNCQATIRDSRPRP